MRILAFILDPAVVIKILRHIANRASTRERAARPANSTGTWPLERAVASVATNGKPYPFEAVRLLDLHLRRSKVPDNHL